MSMSPEAFAQGVDLALKVIAWHVWNSPVEAAVGAAREHIRALAEKGLEIKVRWAGPHDRHVSRWDAVDAYTLAAAKSLVERSAR